MRQDLSIRPPGYARNHLVSHAGWSLGWRQGTSLPNSSFDMKLKLAKLGSAHPIGFGITFQHAKPASQGLRRLFGTLSGMHNDLSHHVTFTLLGPLFFLVS